MNTLLILAAVAIFAILMRPAHGITSTGLATKGLRSEFFNRFDAAKTHYQDLVTILKSTTKTEDYRWLGSVPQMREWGAGRIAKGLRVESYSVENQKYEATLEVDRDEISDDQTGQIRIRINELALRAATHKDYLLAQLLINGGSSGFLSYDGVTYFNDAHVSGASGSQDNNLTFNVTTPANPTTSEMRDAIMQAVTQMAGFKDDQGLPMMLDMSGLVLVVPPNHYFNAMEAVSAAIVVNTTNVINGLARVISFPYLTATDTFYLLKTDGVVRPFVLQDREPVEFRSMDKDDSEEAFMREKYLYGVRARYRMTYGYPHYAIRTVLN
ncbi:MAG: Mu-like prophage major head subunit gpT family protein [Phycisphaerae bacterium]|nr:Mu-like prophage major head subunit gpT family protein [Phycisphaerae bacterium]